VIDSQLIQAEVMHP